MNDWGTEVRIVSFLLLSTLIGGWVQGSFLLAFALSCAGILLWLLWRLRGVQRILGSGGILPDSGSGLLQNISRHINQLQYGVEQQERYNSQVVSLFRGAFEVFPDAVIILNPKWHILWCNQSSKDVFGLSGRSDNYTSLVEEAGHPVLEEYLKTGVFESPLVLELPTDLSRVVSIRVVRLPEDDNLLLVAREITRLYHVDQMRRDFVANVSHELKTPLTVIGGYLESMHGDDVGLSEHWQRPIQLMHQQSKRMHSIVDDLLLISRLDREHEEFSPVEVDVPGLLRDVISSAEVLANDSGHKVRLDAEQGLHLLGESKILESLFYNTVVNAVQHTPNGSSVEVFWFSESGTAVFQVIDSGDGIPARHLPHLTEPFYRVDTGRSRDSGGTGLGLSIVKRSLERHKGQLKINSEIGKGTDLRCEFPPELVVTKSGE